MARDGRVGRWARGIAVSRETDPELTARAGNRKEAGPRPTARLGAAAVTARVPPSPCRYATVSGTGGGGTPTSLTMYARACLQAVLCARVWLAGSG